MAFHRVGDAAKWATGLQEATADESWPHGAEIRVRVGLHTGEAEERAGDYFGPSVNTAARIAAAGHGGQILLSAVTASLLGEGELHDLGSFHLEGVGGHVHIFQLGDGDHPRLRT